MSEMTAYRESYQLDFALNFSGSLSEASGYENRRAGECTRVYSWKGFNYIQTRDDFAFTNFWKF